MTSPSPASGAPMTQIAPEEGELVLNKTYSGAFATLDLERALHERHVASLVITGRTSDVYDGARGRRPRLRRDGGLRRRTAPSGAMYDAALEAIGLRSAPVRPTDAVPAALPVVAH
jgi:hypothetical protein